MRMTPPAIYHDPERPVNYHQMINDMALNIHLRQQATKLLHYYASLYNGFKPAKLTVSRNTGIPVDDVDRVRKQLIDHGLIYYLSKRCIILKWNRITIFAMLDKPINNARLGYFKPAEEGYNANHDKTSIRFPRIKDLPEFHRLKVKNDCLTEIQKYIMNRLERMTVIDFYEWLSFSESEEKEDGAA